MSVLIPAFLFFVFLNPSGLAEEVLRGSDSLRALLIGYAIPAVLGLLSEGIALSRFRRVGLRESFACVIQNLAAGLLGLVVAAAAFLGTTWFDALKASVVYLGVLCLIAGSVVLLGGRLHLPARGRSGSAGPKLKAYFQNMSAVVLSGLLGLFCGLALK